MAGSHCAGREIRILARVVWDDKVWAIACKVKIVLHYEAKIPFCLPP